VREAVDGKTRVDSAQAIHFAVVIGTQEDNRVHPGEVLIHVCGQEFTGARVSRALTRLAQPDPCRGGLSVRGCTLELIRWARCVRRCTLVQISYRGQRVDVELLAEV